jgi:hypothetical protein
MLTTVAMLVIILGLMVSLARYVRDRSSQTLTQEQLRKLDELMSRYLDQYKEVPQFGPRMLKIEPLIPRESPPKPVEDAAIARAAKANNAQTIAMLKEFYRSNRTDPTIPPDPFEILPISIYDRGTLRDAWGSPIVFMAGQHQLIGLAPSREGQDQSFFFSAGPDKLYLTREDNIYSYETVAKQ